MFSSIKRVISGDELNVERMESNNDSNNNNVDSQDISSTTLSQEDEKVPTSSVEINTAALIENDMDIDHLNTPGSSLSDLSAARRELETIQKEYRPNNNPNQEKVIVSRFPRNDSKQSSDSSSASMKASSQNSSRDWGWFEDVVSEELGTPSQLKRKDAASSKTNKKKGKKGGLVPSEETSSSDGLEAIIQNSMVMNDAAAMAVTAPTYVLEESLSSQKLWKYTAGNRPPQPVEERAFFEKMWAQNFARSQVEYKIPVEVLTATTPISMSPFADGNFDATRENDLANYNMPSSQTQQKQDVAEATLISRLNDHIEPLAGSNRQTVKGSGSEGDIAVLIKGDNVFGTTVSKSFSRSSSTGGPALGVDTVNISIASYRVVESKKHGKYAQFLVIYREGSIRDTIGIWKRYSDFQELSKKVTQAHEGCASVIANMSPLAVTEEHEVEHLPNAITSWRLLKKRQRWYRCLDAGYLSLKVFLLERFLHDILFESSSPNLLREFISNGKILESDTDRSD